MLVTIQQMAELHGLKYITLKSRVNTKKIKPACPTKRPTFYKEEDFEGILFPVNSDQLGRKEASKLMNERKLKPLDKPMILEPPSTFCDEVRIREQNKTIKALSVYG
jgi:hypothetical protein